MRYVFGLIGIIIGVLIVWKTYPLTQFFGKVDWAERHLSSGLGGTYFLYKLIGVALIILSAMYLFHILDIFIWPFRSIFSGLANQPK